MILKHEKDSTLVSSNEPLASVEGRTHSYMSKGDSSESVLGLLGNESQSVIEAYRQLWRVIRLPPVLSLIGTLLTIKVSNIPEQ
jgi:hypothetical protein